MTLLEAIVIAVGMSQRDHWRVTEIAYDWDLGLYSVKAEYRPRPAWVRLNQYDMAEAIRLMEQVEARD